MKTITTINELTQVLKERKADESYLGIMKRVAINPREYEKYFTWDDAHYTRNCLIKTAEFELLLICYEKAQQTPIHDFDTQDAWVHTIVGKLKEERFRLNPGGAGLEKVGSVTIGPTEFSYISGYAGMHRFINTYESRSVSLNLYARPVEKWKEHDFATGEVTEKAVSHDTIYVLP